jgi:hypothetical protein
MTLTKASEKQIEKLASQTQEGFLDNLTGAFFRRIDWWAFWIVLAATFAVYFYTLAPTVTLEDSAASWRWRRTISGCRIRRAIRSGRW